MNIGIVCTMINGFGKRGYYNSQEIGLGRAIVQQGHFVTIYKGVEPDEPNDVVLDEVKGLIIRYIPMKHIGAMGLLDTHDLSKDLDAIICFSDNQWFIRRIERFCRKHDMVFVPYVGTCHSNRTGTFRAFVSDTLLKFTTIPLYKKHTTVAKNETAEAELKKLGVKDIRIGYVGLDPLNLRRYFRSTDKSALRKEYGFSDDDVIVATVARFHPEKRIPDMIDIFAHIWGKKNYKFLLIGDGEDLPLIEKKIKDYRLEDSVKIIPRVQQEYMWEIYRISDYFVNLCTHEIFGMAIMEAVYYECSVAAIASLGPSVTLAGMAGHKLCDTDRDVEDWLTGPYPSEAELQESSEKMLNKFGWDKTAELFISIIEKEKTQYVL